MRQRVAAAVACALCALVVALGVCPAASEWPASGLGQSPEAASDALRSQPQADIPLQGESQSQQAPQAASSDFAQSPMRPEDDPDAFGGAPYESGTVLVSLAPDAAADEVVAAVGQAAGATLRVESAGADFVRLSLPAGLSVEGALQKLADVPGVQGVQPNFRYYLADSPALGEQLASLAADGAAAPAASGASASAPTSDASEPALVPGLVQLAQEVVQAYTNDPSLSEQWALRSIRAFDAWDIVKSNRNVTVAVIDNLFNIGHEDLAGNVVAPYNAVLQREGYDLAGASYMGTNSVGHGTHVAGIVAAEADNAMGVAGVSYNASIMPVRVEDDDGLISTEYLVNAYSYVLEHAAEHNVRVINLSIGAGRNDLSWDSTDRQLFQKIDEAYDAGIVTVTAACNAGGGYAVPFYCYPGDYDKCVTVINVTETGQRAALSNYNRGIQHTKDISAPGTSILSVTTLSARNPTSDTYVTMSGTSMAAPCVAGVLALAFAVDPGLSAAEAVSKLYSTATDLNTAENIGDSAFDAQTGWGLVDAYAAVHESAVLLSGRTSVQVGKAIRLVPKPAQSGAWTWSSSDPSVAAVEGASAAGAQIVGVGAGTAVISADNGLGSRAVQTVVVYDPAISGTLHGSPGASLLLSVPSQPAGVWEWSSSNPAVASVGSSVGSGCSISCLRPGTAVITASLADNPAVSATAVVTVSASITAAELRNLHDLVYTGEPLQQADLQVVLGGSVLVEGRDYTVTYSNNVEVGTALVTVRGTGGYVGSKTKSFRIGAASIEDALVEGVTAQTYTGQRVHLPGLRLSIGDEELALSGDYLALYENNVNAGTASVHLYGKGDYVGVLDYDFEVLPAPIDDAALTVVSTKTYTGQAHKTNVVVSLDGHTLSSPFDYKVEYADNVNAGNARIMVTGRGNYCGSVQGQMLIRPASLTGAVVELPQRTYGFTGEAVCPAPTVRIDSQVLQMGVDYRLEYADNVNAGFGSVAVVGIGNYEGEVARAFEIAPALMSEAVIAPVEGRYYTGSPQVPVPNVTWNNAKLRLNADYTLEYLDNVECGTATVLVRGVGNYAGSCAATFEIVGRPVYIEGPSAMAVGDARTWPMLNCALSLVSGEGIVSVNGADVTALAPGTATVAVIDLRGVTIATRTITVTP